MQDELEKQGLQMLHFTCELFSFFFFSKGSHFICNICNGWREKGKELLFLQRERSAA